MLFSKIYLINLERKKDKLIRMFDKLARVGILGNIPIEVIPAIDGEKIDDDFLNKMDAKPWPHWKDPWFGRGITTGDIGCSLSHNLVWKKIIESNNESSLIIEDDGEFLEDFLGRCKTLSNDLSGIDWDLLYLGRKPIFPEKEEALSESLTVPNYSYWTVGYVLTKRGAEKLYKTSFKRNIIPIDEYIPYMYGRPNDMIAGKFDYGSNLIALASSETIINPEERAFQESDTENSEPYVPKVEDMMEWGQKIHAFTVATSENNGLGLMLNSAKKYGVNVQILGLGTEWTGGEKPRLDYPGGGQKINILKEKIKDLNNDDIVIFTDAYDIIYNANLNEIVTKFKQTGLKALFAAELTCWPDESLAEEYPYTPTDYRFLNSGCFISEVGKLKEILTEPIEDEDDDQLYYTKVYLDEVKKDGTPQIGLDYSCNIFQTSLEHEDLRIDGGKSRFFNAGYRTIPSIIHGNGDILRKMDLHQAYNHLISFKNHYGFSLMGKKELDNENLPKILLNVNINRKNEDKALENAFLIEYPTDKIILHVNLMKGKEFNVSEQTLAKLMEYSSFSMTKNNSNDVHMNMGAFIASQNFEFDYMFTIDEECDFINPEILKNLVFLEKDIVSPLLMGKENESYSNVWPGDKEIISLKTEMPHMLEYNNLIKRRMAGCWIVPYIDKAFLIKKDLINKIGLFYKKNRRTGTIEGLDVKFNKDAVTFCGNLIENGILSYVDNRNVYGYISV